MLVEPTKKSKLAEGKSKPAEVVKKKRLAIESALPSKIVVFGIPFEVKVCNLKGSSGDCTLDDRVIRIHQTQSLEQAKATLWHEAIHAAIGLSGLSELLEEKSTSGNLEEALVRCMEHAFSDVVDISKLAVDS